ncbi:hypothetical protein [Flagellimonas allohymeniacidonis]|uniref:Uncharacterized protein n=1 Tax=Flagellimonas allohymeniacidonis TaxID=2517819 RepID=A0A4Q8QC06_9FLAO|nr:hypothetical protein [Allomuricauda hymeniacidonis]TAI47922.1 hypothetical protein EW142_14825 [Allomuricauda hymeniacidonis]
MERRLLILIGMLVLLSYEVYSQNDYKKIQFEHFTMSRGDAEDNLLLEIPYSQVVVLNNSLNSSSGFGMTLNFHGTMVIIDHMETMPDGRTQVVLRREDGRDFYGYKPTIKAILSNKTNKQNNLAR